MWHIAALSNNRDNLETRQQIANRFAQLYEAAGEPKDATLFDMTDSEGYFCGLAITEQTAKRVPELLQEFTPWHEIEEPPGNLSWVAGAGRPDR